MDVRSVRPRLDFGSLWRSPDHESDRTSNPGTTDRSTNRDNLTRIWVLDDPGPYSIRWTVIRPYFERPRSELEPRYIWLVGRDSIQISDWPDTHRRVSDPDIRSQTVTLSGFPTPVSPTEQRPRSDLGTNSDLGLRSLRPDLGPRDREGTHPDLGDLDLSENPSELLTPTP